MRRLFAVFCGHTPHEKEAFIRSHTAHHKHLIVSSFSFPPIARLHECSSAQIDLSQKQFDIVAVISNCGDLHKPSRLEYIKAVLRSTPGLRAGLFGDCFDRKSTKKKQVGNCGRTGGGSLIVGAGR